MVHATGPAWHSMAGGRIDTLMRLDARLGSDEGGPVLTLGGRLIGMSTSGPRRRALVIPAATIERVVDPLLNKAASRAAGSASGCSTCRCRSDARGGRTRPRHDGDAAGPGAPAEQAGVLPGDIILEVDGKRTGRAAAAWPRRWGPERIGQPATLKLLRAGEVHLVTVTIGAQTARA